MTNMELLARRERWLGKGMPLFYREPINIVRGEGVTLWDETGKSYIDMYNNVPCVGHAHPHVVDAMARQAATLNVHSRYLNDAIVDYAERLLGHHDPGIERVVFSCTGTEANEVAIKMARHATGGRGIICTDAAYHGNSGRVGQLTHAQRTRQGETRSFPFPQTFRPLAPGVTGEALTDLYLAELQREIDGLASDGIPLAGLLLCSLLCNEGLPDVPPGFFPRAVQMIHKAGGVVIADEVQAGLCRSGRWWGYEVMDFVPDIVVMGKPLGNGMPLAATAARGDIVDIFRAETRYFNTFASSPLQAAAGAAVLDVIENEQLDSQVAHVGAYLTDRIDTLTANSGVMADVRGHGLFVGIEWVKDRESNDPDREGAADVANRLKEKGFLVSNAGALGNVLKIRPPLVFGKEHADAFLGAFEEVLQEIGDRD